MRRAKNHVYAAPGSAYRQKKLGTAPAVPNVPREESEKTHTPCPMA